jgi:lipopolysaccharide export system ATP-binding protein
MIHTLEVDDLRLDLGRRSILSDIHLRCETGKIVGLLGRNGEGKTCLMRIIYGELGAGRLRGDGLGDGGQAAKRRSAGLGTSIRFDGYAESRAYRRPGLISFLPQFNFIPGSLTLKRIFGDFELEFGELTEIFPEFNATYPFPFRQLSGGQRRLIENYIIVRSKTKFSLLDEPFSHLMPLQIEKMKELIRREKKNKGLLITDHLYEEIVDVADNLYVLAGGKTHPVQSLTDLETTGYVRLR